MTKLGIYFLLPYSSYLNCFTTGAYTDTTIPTKSSLSAIVTEKFYIITPKDIGKCQTISLTLE